MPSPYRRDAARLKAEILERVLTGESQRAICASPGMPGAQTVRHWALADAAFGAELLAARRRGDWMRRFAFDEAVAAAFLARARAGETINSLVGSAGMPSRATYTYWTRTQGAFAEAVFALRQRRGAGLRARGLARWRAFDQGVADRVIVALNRELFAGKRLEEVLAADPMAPSRPTLRRWRREQPEFDAVLRTMFAVRRQRGPPIPEDWVADVAAHIVEGGSFASFGRGSDGVSRQALRRWFRRDPNFARAVREACAWREEWYRDQILMASEADAPGSVAEKARAVGRLKRHLVRLRHRPGATHRRRAPAPPSDQPGDERGQAI